MQFNTKRKARSVVRCDESGCGVLLDKDQAQKVTHCSYEIHYCSLHRKPYDRVELTYGWSGPGYMPNHRFYKEFEVSGKTGNPIGYERTAKDKR